MKLIPTKEFNKTVSRITDIIAKKRLDELTLKLESAKSLSEISNVIPLKGVSELFRITTVANGDFFNRLFCFSQENVNFVGF